MARRRMTWLPFVLAAMIAAPGPALAQFRLFKDGQIITIGPTKSERRARQMGVMMGAMSGRRPAPDASRPQGAPAGQPAPIQSTDTGR